MREQLRQKMREMVATLGKGEALLDSRVKKKNTDMLEQLLEDMQNSAIAIGKSLNRKRDTEQRPWQCWRNTASCSMST